MSSVTSTSSSFSGSGRSSPIGKSKKSTSGRPVVTIRALSASAKNEEIGDNKLLSGDIVEQVTCSDGLQLIAPFAGGKSGLLKELRRLYSAGQTNLTVGVRRTMEKFVSIRVCIASDDSSMLRKNYVLKAINDGSYIVTFTDSTEEQCLAMQEMRRARMTAQLAKSQLTDVTMSYAWEEKMKHLQGGNTVFSMLILPHAPDSSALQFGILDDTVTRAMTWFSSSQLSGVPVSFLSIQTEPLLTKVSGQQGSSRTVSASASGDLSSIVNTGIYGFEDYHGIDIGVVRAVRVWYVPNFSEVVVQLKVEFEETRLGVGISRTEEGFCHVSSVEPGTAADRAGLRELLVLAQASGKLLVVTRVAGEKITPWHISSSGRVCCFDTVSISRKLSAYRFAGQTASLHLMGIDGITQSMVSVESEPAILSSGSDSGVSNALNSH